MEIDTTDSIKIKNKSKETYRLFVLLLVLPEPFTYPLHIILLFSDCSHIDESENIKVYHKLKKFLIKNVKKNNKKNLISLLSLGRYGF